MSQDVDSQLSSLGVIPPEHVASWGPEQPGLLKLAAWLNRWLPRGKGAVPRWIGRSVGKSWQTSITTDSGCRLAVHPAHLDLYVSIQNEGAWESWVRAACIRAIRPNDVMFDVGANAGAISNEIGLACPNIEIKAFEPQPRMAELVAVSAALNGLECIDVFQVAIGDHTGTINLHLPAHSLHASTLSLGESGEQSVQVPLHSLDDLVRDEGFPLPDLIKIDVEGGELAVLNGAKRTIRSNLPVIIFEANDNCVRFGYDRKDLFDAIADCGDYCFFKVAPGDVLASPIARRAEFSDCYEEVHVETA